VLDETAYSFKIIDDIHQKELEKKNKEIEEENKKHRDEIKKLEKMYKKK